MALQVWLPLNGNLNNQGLTDITVTNSDATLDNNGKLGKCYYFNGSSARISCNSSLTIKYPISVCGWFKPTDFTNSNTQYWISYNTATGGSAGHSIGIGTYGGALAIFYNGTFSRISNSGITNNNWYHIAVTINADKKIIAYLNGIQIATYNSSADQPNSAWITLGARSNSSTGGAGGASYYYKGYMNDARVYDSCLSPKEIEILSRGLICHYPLNGGGRGGDNLLKNTNQGKTYWTWSAASGSRTVETYETTGVKMTVVEVGSSWNMWYYSGLVPSDIEPDTDYTVSMDILPPESKPIQCSIRQTNGLNPICNAVTYNVTANKWNHAVFNLHSTSSFTASGQVVYMNGIAPDTVGKTIYIKNLKLEKGTTATPWIPNSADSAYTAMGYDSTTEYDVSGYGYNGTKNGTIAYSNNTARYSVSTTFNGTNTYIEADPLPAETKTISVWIKTTWTSPSSYNVIIHDKNTGFAIGWAGASLITYAGTSNGGSGSVIATSGIWTANKWHNVVVVKTGDKTRDVYIDTVKMTPSSGNYWVADLNKLDIGTRHYSGSYSGYFDGQLSDFRAYATALTETQIKELYNTAISVSNNGSLLGYELVES
jgi:hypothetical protein